MRVLVTGGAGYIGSVVAERLVARGDSVVVYDNLLTGHLPAIPPTSTAPPSRSIHAGLNHDAKSDVPRAFTLLADGDFQRF